MAGIKGRSGDRRAGAGRPRTRPVEVVACEQSITCKRCRLAFVRTAQTGRRPLFCGHCRPQPGCCADCGVPLSAMPSGRGRPRIRCGDCSPEQRKEPGFYVTDRAHEVVCANRICARVFIAQNAAARFCTDRCSNLVSNRRAQERRRDRSPRACGGCGSVFAPAYGDLRSRYCSQACRVQAEYRKKSGHTHVRRARKYGCDYEPVDKLLVFERDGWRCQICGVPTPKSRQGTLHRNAPVLDHRIPLGGGWRGPHTYANCQCACRACNTEKSAKSAVGRLPLLSVPGGRAQA